MVTLDHELTQCRLHFLTMAENHCHTIQQPTKFGVARANCRLGAAWRSKSDRRSTSTPANHMHLSQAIHPKCIRNSRAGYPRSAHATAAAYWL